MNFRLLFVAGFAAVSVFSQPSSALMDQNPSLERVASALVLAGEQQLSDENYADAQRSFERALVANPASVVALLNLGRVHEAQGRVGRSLKYYRQALQIDPRNQKGLEAQAMAFLKRSLVDRAERNADRLAEICGDTCVSVETVRTAIANHRQQLAANTTDPGR